MLHVDRAAGAAGHGDRLGYRLFLCPGLQVLGVPQVQAQWHAVPGGQVAVAEHLVQGDPDVVLGLFMDTQGSGPQVHVGQADQLGDLRVAGVVDADPEVCAVGRLVGRSAVVDRRPVLSGLDQEPVHGVVDAVHAQVGGNPVGHLVPLAVAGGRVGQDVDEARGHDEAAGVQRGPTGQGIEADPGDGVAVDSQVADGVET